MSARKTAEHERVRNLLASDPSRASLTHRQVATLAGASLWVVRMVRRERGEVQEPTPQKRRAPSQLRGLVLDDLRIIARTLSHEPSAMRLRLRVLAEIERRVAA